MKNRENENGRIFTHAALSTNMLLAAAQKLPADSEDTTITTIRVFLRPPPSA